MSSVKSADAYRLAIGAAQAEAGKDDADWNWRYRHALEKRELEVVSCRAAPYGEHYPESYALAAPNSVGVERGWEMKSYVVWKN